MTAQDPDAGTTPPGSAATWADDTPGLLVLPSGLRVRGRGVRRPMPPGPAPTFAVHLLGDPPPPVPWASRWVRWPDMWLPRSTAELRDALAEIRERARTERVEVACAGGHGRTGTTLACLAALEGVPRRQAVHYVRRHYDPHAVETPWQRWLVRRMRLEELSPSRAVPGRPRGCGSTPRGPRATSTPASSTRGSRVSAAR